MTVIPTNTMYANPQRIIVSNTHISVYGLDEMQINRLNKRFSIFDKSARFSPLFKKKQWDGYRRFGKIRVDNFNKEFFVVPIGLYNELSSAMEDYLDIDPTTFEIIDNRSQDLLNLLSMDKIKDGYKIGVKTLRDYQIEAVNNLMQNTWLGLPMPNGVINGQVNSGKTSVAMTVLYEEYQRLKYNKLCMLFIVHSVEIANQFMENFYKDTGITCGFIGQGKWSIKPITVALTATLYSKYKNRKEDDRFTSLADKCVGIVYDEVHHSSAESSQSFLPALKNVVIRMGLTGTTNEKDEIKKLRLFSVTGSVLIRVTNQELIARGISAKPTCYIYDVDKPVFENNPRMWQLTYSQGIANNKYRNDLIVKLIKEQYKAKKSVLVLVEQISHGEQILDGLKRLKNVEFIQGNDLTETRQGAIDNLASGKTKILISTAILDEGVDVSGINTIIYARGLKSERKLLQGIGRGLRRKSDGSGLTYIDFYDKFNSYLNNHSEERIATLREEGFDVIFKEGD